MSASGPSGPLVFGLLSREDEIKAQKSFNSPPTIFYIHAH